MFGGIAREFVWFTKSAIFYLLILPFCVFIIDDYFTLLTSLL